MSLDLSSMSDDDLKALYASQQSIHQIESNGAPDSSTITNPKSGAEGSMQVVKATQDKPGFGVRPSDGTPEDTAREGRDYHTALTLHYKDPITAAVAYNWGPGNADKWIKNGAKLEDLPDETLKYVYQMHNPKNPDAPTDTTSKPQAQSKNPAAPKDSQMGPPVSAKPAGTWEALGNAATHPIDTAKAIGHSVADTAGKFVDQVDNNPAQAAKGALLGVANGLTFGGYKKYLQPALSQAVNGGSFEDAQLRVHDMYDAQGPATTVGELGSAFIPGIGQASLANAAVKAVPVASRAAKVLTGAAAGGAEGVANYVGHSQGPMNLSDASAYAALGALPGGVIGSRAKHTDEQLTNSFLKKAGGDEETARMQAEIIGDIHARANSSTGNGGIKAKQLNSIEGKYVRDVERPLKESGQLTDDMRYAIQDRDGLSDVHLDSLANKGDHEAALADAITKAQVMRTLTAQQEAKGGIRKGLRVAVDNGLLSQVPIAGPLLGIAPVRHTVLKMLGGAQSREQVAGKLIAPKQIAMAQAAAKSLGPSAASKSVQDLQQMAKAAAEARSALQASQAPFGTKTGRQGLDAAENVAAKAAADAEKQKTADLKAAAQRAQDIQKRREMYTQQRQATAQEQNGARLDQQTQEAQAAQAAQQARAQASQGNLETSLQVRQANAADTRAASTQAMAQQAQAAQAARDRLAGRVAANADNRPVRPVAPTPVDPATEMAQRAAEAKTRLEARINARVKTNTTENVAKGRQRTAEATAAETQAKVDKVASGDFGDLDTSHPRLKALLQYVGKPEGPVSAADVLPHLSEMAAKDPAVGQKIVQLMSPGSKKLKGEGFYGIQKELQRVHGNREAEATAEKAASKGALSEASGAPSGEGVLKTHIANQTAYEAGIANRQEYARKTFEAAPTEHVKSLVARLSTLSNEDVRMAKYNSAYAKATPAERDFMDRKVEHMIHYGNE